MWQNQHLDPIVPDPNPTLLLQMLLAPVDLGVFSVSLVFLLWAGVRGHRPLRSAQGTLLSLRSPPIAGGR